jgi:hypothetical protein
MTLISPVSPSSYGDHFVLNPSDCGAEDLVGAPRTDTWQYGKHITGDLQVRKICYTLTDEC